MKKKLIVAALVSLVVMGAMSVTAGMAMSAGSPSAGTVYDGRVGGR